ncbi:MAG: hypothetical protein WD872_20085 [Pirellulaceae bacterium]
MKWFSFAMMLAILAAMLLGLSRLGGQTFAQSIPAHSEPPQAETARPATKKLPWERLRTRNSEPILRPPASPREILERYDIGPSQLDSFVQGQPLGPGEEDVLAKILFRFSRLGLDNIQRWTKKNVAWDQLAAAPNDYRAEFFSLRGRVTRVEEHPLLPELAELLEFDRYYRVTLELDDAPYQALICTRQVPEAWAVGQTIDQPAAADGLFLKLGGGEGTAAQLIFAAGRVAWLPDRPQPQQFVGPDQIALAGLGFDVGLFDDVRQGNGQGLLGTDREAFYQLLAALGRADESGQTLAKGKPLNVVPLIEKPQEHHGDFLVVQGIARRITKIPVSDADVRRRFGIDHYYEIDLFVPLGDKTLRFGKPAAGEQAPVFRNSFPVTLVARKLPPGVPEGDNLAEPLRAEAVFFKLWAFRSTYMSQFDRPQPAPLVIGFEPQIVQLSSPSYWISNALVGAALGMALVVIVVVFFWYRGSDGHDRAARRNALQHEQRPPDFSQL